MNEETMAHWGAAAPKEKLEEKTLKEKLMLQYGLLRDCRAI
jgi:hypothetical protein